MNSFFLMVFAGLWGGISVVPITESQANNPTLRLVHVLFRHGERNPDDDSIISSTYANESYYPEGFGQLTNKGKQTEYNIGNLLRTRYDDFLTKTWRINYLDPRSTNFNRTKMSLELMLAGLYPPEGDQTWSPLSWQPIPYNYVETSQDKETRPSEACSRINQLYENTISRSDIVEYAKRYEELFAILDSRAGTSGSSFEEAFTYYFGLTTQQEVGYPLDDWTSAIFPEPIHSATVDYYYVMTNTTIQKRILAGYLLKKILSDTQSLINGTMNPPDRKMFIYSAHEFNVATMLLSLEAFHLIDIPTYGSHILFEIHEQDGVWGIKLFYQDYTTNEPHSLRLPSCNEFCPFDEFYRLVEEILPADDSDCYGSS